MTAQVVADAIKRDVSGLSPPQEISSFIADLNYIGSAMQIDWWVDASLTSAQAAMVMKNAMMARFKRMQEVRVIAANRGYILPDDPLERYSDINWGRRPGQPLPLTAQEATDLYAATIDLSKVARAYDRGEVNFDRPQPAAQISSFEVSVDGLSPQSGDALVDLLGYQPDADYIKKKRALDALARLDFSKRKPYLLFIADVITGGRRRNGTIVCWSQMRDASYYEVRRRDVFAMRDLPPITVTNEQLRQHLLELKDEPFFRELVSFYDWVNPGDVVAMIDDTVSSNTLYAYEIVGVQKKAPVGQFIFDVPVNTLYLTPAQISQITAGVNSDRLVFGNERVSPYPAISQIIFGDASYGWLLAGCNVLAARRRNALPEEIRKVSYIGSDVESILGLSSSGKIVCPADLAALQSSVEKSISSYGISQTILALIDGLALTLFISGKDDPDGFQPTVEALERSSSGLAKIISAIDPQTATVDPSLLLSSLTSAISRSGQQYETQQITQGTNQVVAALGLGPVTPPTQLIPTGSIDQIVGTGLIDLTTYTGISRFMQIIRSIYDFFPGTFT